MWTIQHVIVAIVESNQVARLVALDDCALWNGVIRLQFLRVKLCNLAILWPADVYDWSGRLNFDLKLEFVRIFGEV